MIRSFPLYGAQVFHPAQNNLRSAVTRSGGDGELIDPYTFPVLKSSSIYSPLLMVRLGFPVSIYPDDTDERLMSKILRKSEDQRLNG